MSTKITNGIVNGSVKQLEQNNNSLGDVALFDLQSLKLIWRCALWFTASMVVYIFWILNWSIAPVLLLMLLATFYHEKSKDKLKEQLYAKYISTTDEKTLIHSTFKPDKVPPWILFPDKVIAIFLTKFNILFR